MLDGENLVELDDIISVYFQILKHFNEEPSGDIRSPFYIDKITTLIESSANRAMYLSSDDDNEDRFGDYKLKFAICFLVGMNTNHVLPNANKRVSSYIFNKLINELGLSTGLTPVQFAAFLKKHIVDQTLDVHLLLEWAYTSFESILHSE